MLKEKKRIIIVIMALSFVKMSMGAVTPALSCIAAAFPDSSSTSVAALATLPVLTGIPCSLLSGRIVGRYVKYKSVAIFGLTILFLSGIMPCFAESMTELLVWRGIMGIGLGALIPLAPSMTMNTLKHQNAEKQIGWNSLVQNFGAIVFQLVTGYASVYSWRLGFLSYVFVVPVLIIVFRNLDEPQIEQNKETVKGKLTTNMKKSLAFWCLIGMVFSMFFYTMINNLSSIIMNNGYGSAGESALVFSTFSFGGVLGSYLLKSFITKLEKQIIVVGAMICAAGYFTLTFGESLIMMFIGAGVFGVGFGLYVPSITLFGGMAVSPENRPFAVSCVMVASSLAGFLSVYVFTAIRNILLITSDRFSIGLSAMLYLVVSVTFLISNIHSRIKNKI